MKKLADFIVKYRNAILIVAVILLIPSAFGYFSTEINYDLLSYLPEDCESMIAQDILDKDFNLASVNMLVVNGMSDKQVVKLEAEIEKIDGVETVLWRDDLLDISVPKEALPESLQKVLYSDDATMMIITFEEGTASQRTMNAISEIKKYADEECYLGGISAINEDVKDLTEKDTPIYVALAVVLCLIVLFLGLESTIAPFVFLLGIVFPIVYNFGTNFFLGEISYITKALAAVLQLGVTLDYSIFLLHRYQEEKRKDLPAEQAMSNAIVATFTSITSSSITTIAGFLALCAMQLTLGKDIGIVMAKGVILGVISTILILPSLLMIFDRLIDKYKHPVLIREIKILPKIVTKYYKIILVIFIGLFGLFAYGQNHTSTYYDLVSNMPKSFASVTGTTQLKEKFNMTTTHFVLISDELETKEVKDIINQIEDLDGITNVIALEKYIGPTFVKEFLPNSLKNVLYNGGYEVFVVNSDYKAATDEVNAQLDAIDDIIHEYDENGKIAGEGSLVRDLMTTCDRDFMMVNIVSVIAIFIIILITFKSISLPVLLVASIEFAISVNMGIPFFTGNVLSFIAGIVIGTIQLGACVDYAILMTTRFKEELENGNDVKEAITIAIQKSSTSIITSALCFFAACMGVYFLSIMDLVSGLCLLLARGAVISAVVILTVLPSLLILTNNIISKTTKKWPKVEKKA